MPPKRPDKSGKSGGRTGNIGGLVNHTSSDIIRLYSLLPEGAQQELLVTLSRIGRTRTAATTGNPELPTGRRLPAAQGGNPPVAAARAQPEIMRREQNSATSRRSFDRPIVRDLAAAARQRTRTRAQRASAEGEADNAVISAALAALNRARIQNVPEADWGRSLLQSVESVETFRTLWPNVAAAENPPLGVEQPPLDIEEAVPLLPDIQDGHEALPDAEVAARAVPRQTVVDGVDFATAQPGSEYSGVGGTSYVTHVTVEAAFPPNSPILVEVPQDILEFHLAAGRTMVLSANVSALAESFMRGEDLNYVLLRSYFRVRTTDSRLVLLSVPRRWGDDTPPRPSKKKRKKSRAKDTL